MTSYNGAGRWPKAVSALLAQARTDMFEVILVDNNSDDQTAVLAKEFKQRFSQQFRYVFEPRQGQSFARSAGVASARANILGFIDDDNAIGEGWLSEACRLFRENEKTGLVGGRIRNRVPDDVRKEIGIGNMFLGELDLGDQAIQITSGSNEAINGAGMVISRKAWYAASGDSLRLNGRSGHGLTAGEDRELMYRVIKQGFEVWYNPDMFIDHHIESRRWDPSYVLRLAFASGQAQPYLRSLKHGSKSTKLVKMGGALSDCFKAFRYGIRRRCSFHDAVLFQYHLGSIRGLLFPPTDKLSARRNV